MHGNERHVEPADEKADGEQHIAAMGKRLTQGLAEPLVAQWLAFHRGIVRQQEGERDQQPRGDGEDQECVMPAETLYPGLR